MCAPLRQKLQALQSQVEELPVLSIRLLGLLPARPGDHLGHTGKGIQRKPAKLPSFLLCNTALWVGHPPALSLRGPTNIHEGCGKRPLEALLVPSGVWAVKGSVVRNYL